MKVADAVFDAEVLSFIRVVKALKLAESLNDRAPRSIAASWCAIHQRLQRLSDSHFEILKLLERRERGLHELRLSAMAFQRGDQVVDLSESVVQ